MCCCFKLAVKKKMTKTGSFLEGIHSLVREAGSEEVRHSVITNKIAPSLTQWT